METGSVGGACVTGSVVVPGAMLVDVVVVEGVVVVVEGVVVVVVLDGVRGVPVLMALSFLDLPWKRLLDLKRVRGLSRTPLTAWLLSSPACRGTRLGASRWRSPKVRPARRALQ